VGARAATVPAGSGFRPYPGGFSFENYGSNEPYQNLTAADMPLPVLPRNGKSTSIRSTVQPDADPVARGHLIVSAVAGGRMSREGTEPMSSVGPPTTWRCRGSR
jgi:hypothetical protein